MSSGFIFAALNIGVDQLSSANSISVSLDIVAISYIIFYKKYYDS